MRVEIYKDIFQDNNESVNLLDLVRFFISKRHELVIDDIEQIESMKGSEWYKELNKRDKLFLDEAIEKSVRKQKNKLKIVVSNSDIDNYFSTKEAILYLNQTLYILVENAEYEAPFINAIIRNFDFSGELINAFEEKWLDFYHGGGSSIESVLRGQIKNSFKSPFFIKSKERYLRFFVLKDSDMEFVEILADGSIVKNQLPEAKTKFLKENKIPYYILYKRELRCSDNYL